LRTWNVNVPSHSHTADFDSALQVALHRVERNLQSFGDSFPDNSARNGVYAPRVPRKDSVVGGNSGWTTSFWTGQLWLAFDLTRNPTLKLAAQRHSESFHDRLENRVDLDHHDLGFLYTPSTIADYRLTGSLRARDTAIAAAADLMRRYLPGPGIFQAWGSPDDPEQRGRMIVDCLMNLPLLYFATRETGEDHYANAAESHARQTAKFLVRPDATTHHTYYFDVATGAARFGRTRQGASDDSCWARGQAWAIYGFALMYFHTGDAVFLEKSRQVVDVFLERLPANRIAHWDLIYGESSNEPWDSSACAIAACGLMELSDHLGKSEGSFYRESALAVLNALTRTCAANDATNALLLRGTHNRPKGLGVEQANLWGDYFYLEALTRVHCADKPWVSFWRHP
jgi:unsaturated chondroitin disaccharide hydrolase